MAPAIDLRAHRINQGLSAAKAAEKIGVSRDTLERAESGERTPQVANAYAIASFYGLKVTDIWPLEHAA